MACCISRLSSQRCILSSLRQTLKQKAVNSSPVGSCVRSQKNSCVVYMSIYSSITRINEHSTLLSCFTRARSLLMTKLTRTCKFGTFSRYFYKEDVDFRSVSQTKKLTAHRHVSSDRNSKEQAQMAKEMREDNILTIPNILCFGRILASPFLGYLVLSENYPAALLLFIVAGFTDMLDGFIARRFPSQKSYLGSVLDPTADKILVGFLTVTLAVVHLIPIPLAVVILGRDLGLILSSFVVRYITLPRPRTFSRFFDVQHPTVQVTPSFIGKVNTALQLALIASSLTAPVLEFTGHTGLTVLQYVVGLTTVISGVDYMISGRGVNILKNNQNI